MTEVSDKQWLNAEMPIVVRLLPIVTEERPEQLEKALLPIEVTLFGIVNEERPAQPAKADTGFCLIWHLPVAR